MGSLETYDTENQHLLKVIHVVKNEELMSDVQVGMLRMFLGNVGQVLFGTRLCVLLLVVPLAFVAKCLDFGSPWIFALSLIGLTPLAERVSFLTEQITYFTGPTVGGLLNATCGNATELIIALFALHQRKIHVLKYSLLGSIISNLLLVLGSSLLCGGIANLDKEQRYDRKQVDANSLLLLLGILCQILPILFRFGGLESPNAASSSVLEMSRASSIVMLIAYAAYIFFQLKSHSRVFESQEEEENDEEVKEEKPVIGFCSAFVWLVIMTVIIAILSEYVVGTIEAASDTWGISVSFISIILLPIVGNAAEHAGSIIFAYKNKLDISLGVAMGSATQISTFLVPLCVIVAWIMGIPMSLDFGLLQTGCLAFSILLTALTLQDGSSHYLKGLILCLAYVVIGACFFVQHVPSNQSHANDLGIQLFSEKLGISSR
ncbi:calcium/proton exchanger [Artemisia annua]|uniref:Vacuolar cation/proton exchanger n=1 Tax=Artemisia annua TaxID=35608 RepID=A0A2U1MZ88_ARTAN|nr:calcium/proton exchanger [Artemisia annua]